VQFVRQNLDAGTLLPYMEGHTNVFLKLDIEGWEFRVLPSVPLERVKQLVVEIHSPADIALHPTYYKGLQDITNDSMWTLLHQLDATHTLVHFHANNGCLLQQLEGCVLPHVFELTYVRNEYVPERVLNIEPLPTPLDMRNVVYKQDYQLYGFPYTQ